MVLDVEPVAAVQPRAVDREWLVVDRVGDEEGHQLLGELARAVVVRGARHHYREAVGGPVGVG